MLLKGCDCKPCATPEFVSSRKEDFDLGTEMSLGYSELLCSQDLLKYNRGERREFFPDHAGKGSLLSRYEAETGLLWMWTGLSCFLSSGDGYVGVLLELQQGCEGPFRSSRG